MRVFIQYMLMRDEEGRKKELNKQDQTNNKAKQHSTPKTVTSPKKYELSRVAPGLTTLYTLDRALYQLNYSSCSMPAHLDAGNALVHGRLQTVHSLDQLTVVFLQRRHYGRGERVKNPSCEVNVNVHVCTLSLMVALSIDSPSSIRTGILSLSCLTLTTP